MTDDPLDGMRERIIRCRRLAKQILIAKATQALLEMAEEIERDLKKLEAERQARRDPSNADSVASDEISAVILKGPSDLQRPLSTQSGH